MFFTVTITKPDTVLFHILDSVLAFYGGKFYVYLYLSFTTIKTVSFLNKLEYVGEFDTVNKVGFAEYPTVLGRKLYEYRKQASGLKTISMKTSNNDWPFPDTYFKSIGHTVRGFSFLFPNASDKLKENLLPSKNLLNIESGSEETFNVLTQTIFSPSQKI